MTVKDIAKQIIDSLPDEADMSEIIQALYSRSNFERGGLEFQEGRGFLQKEAKQRFQKWLN